MNFENENICCLITSIVMLILILNKLSNINLCIVLIFAAVFSIIWRSTKIIFRDNIKDNISLLYNPLFILDFTFAIFGFMCMFNDKNVNNKFLYMAILIFIIGWYLYFMNNGDIARNVHFFGHCYVILIFFFTFYLNIH